MATMSEMEQMLGKAIVDADFREQLMKEPESAAKSIGVELTPAQNAAIKRIDAEKFDQWAQMFMAMKPDLEFLW